MVASLANWFFKACNKALEGEAKRKYFEHAGALLTTDGTDDDLIKFEALRERRRDIKLKFNYMVSLLCRPCA